jgi:hypothetical protein
LTILKNDGSPLVVIDPGLTWFVQVTNNTSAAGLWFTGQFGAGSSMVSASALAGAGLAVDPVDPTRLATNIIAREFSTGLYVIQQSDRAILLVWTGGTETIYLPDIATLLPGFQCYLSNLSVGGILTVQCQVIGQLINKLPSVNCNPGDSFEIAAGPTEFYTIGTPQLSFAGFYFPDGSIANPSIAFVTPTPLHNSGFSHQYSDANNQALNFSLNGNLQASFSLAAGVSVAVFPHIIQTINGTIVFGNGSANALIFLDQGNDILNFRAFNAGGVTFTNMELLATGYLNLPQADFQRDAISYLAWMRTFI